jgi:hypothetical protein
LCVAMIEEFDPKPAAIGHKSKRPN